MARISVFNFALFSVIPVLALALPILNMFRIGPFYLVSRIDPSYMYLTNSVAILCAKQPQIVEHPGTPLSIFGAVVIALMRIATLQSPFCRPEEAFVSPEFYLSSIHVGLQVVIACSIIAFSLRLYECGKSIFAVLAFEVALVISERFASALTLVHPEALIVPAILLFAFVLLPAITGQRDVSTRDTVSAGAVLGFAVAVKFTVLPLALFGLFFVGARRKAIFAISAIASFLFWTLPIVGSYGRMWQWIAGIATHTGYYGTGTVGIPSLSTIFENATALVISNLVTFGLVGSGLAVVIMILIERKFSPLARFLLLSIVICLVQVGITAKHPAERYMLPAAVLGAVICGLVGFWAAQKTRVGGAVCFALVAFAGVVPIHRYYNYFDQKLPEISQKDLSSLRRLTERASADCDITYANEYHSSVEAALVLGNAFMRGAFQDVLRKVYPRYVQRLSGGAFIHFNEVLGAKLPEEAAGKRVCVIGTIPIETAQFPGFQLISTDESYRLYLYQSP